MVWLNRLLLAALLAGTIAFLPRSDDSGTEQDDLARVRAEKEALELGNRRLGEEIAELTAEVRALKEDPRELERIARDDLHLVRPGEVVFEIHEEDPK